MGEVAVRKSFREWPFVVLLALLSAFHIATIDAVPFHPDEATYLYMSSDVDDFVRQPLSLAWNPDNTDSRQIYHLLNAPLTRYWLGIGRSLAGLDALRRDWTWGATWAQNQANGALPGEQLLWTGRFAVTLLMPLSLSFVYATGRLLSGRFAGLAAALALGTNALVLVHGRRAMTEGALLLGLAIALWSLPQAHRRPWLAGLAIALALNAKQFAVALVPVGLLAAAWSPERGLFRGRRAALNVAIVAGTVGLLTLALNPVLWRNPMLAAREMWLTRQDLASRQVADTLSQAPEQVLPSPGERAMVLAAHLFVLPPYFSEVGDYRAQTQSAEVAYMAAPVNHLLRGIGGGGLMLLLTTFGMIAGVLETRHESQSQRRTLVLMLLSTAAIGALMLSVTPLAWQRYAMPLVPVTVLWVGYGLSRIVSLLRGQ